MDPYEKQILWDHLAHLKARIDGLEKALGTVTTIAIAAAVVLAIVIYRHSLW